MAPTEPQPASTASDLEALATRKGVPFLPIEERDVKCGWVRTKWGRYVTWEEMETMNDTDQLRSR